MRTLQSKSMLIYCALLYLSCITAGAAEADVKRFKAEYPAASSRLRKAYNQVHATGTFVRKAGKDQSSPFTWFEFIAGDGLEKGTIVRHRIDEGGADKVEWTSVYSVGRANSFELHQSTADSNQFVIQDVQENKDDLNAVTIKAKLHELITKFILSPVKNGFLSYDELLDPKKFQITKVDSRVDGGRKLVRISFSRLRNAGATLSGEVEMMPDRSWAATQCRIHAEVGIGGRPSAKVKTDVSVAADYGEDQSGVPVPRRVSYEVDGKTKAVEIDSMTLNAESPEKQFLLSYYGLPDVTKSPVGDPTRSYTQYLLLGLAAATLAGSYTLWRRDR